MHNEYFEPIEPYTSSYKHEIIKTYADNPDNKDYMISIPNSWVIMIDDFDNKLSNQNPLPKEIIQERKWEKYETLGVVYPLETTNNLSPFIAKFTKVSLMVVTVYGTNLESGSIAVGTCVITTVPYIFAKQLQHFLTTGEF